MINTSKRFFLPTRLFYIILTPKKEEKIRTRTTTALLILSLVFLTFQTQALAVSSVASESAEDYRAEGYQAQQKGKLDEALTLYTKALALNPDNPAGIYNDMGVIYEQLGLDGKAEDYYRKAADEDQSYLSPYMNLAYLYKKRGDTVNALKFFRIRAERGNPDDFWTQRAQQEIFELDPSAQRALVLDHARQMEQDLVQQAQVEFTDKVARADKHYQAGVALVKSGQYSQAIAQYNQSLLIAPGNPKVLAARDNAITKRNLEEVRSRTDFALKYLDLGDTVSAKDEFRRILTIIPNEPVHVSE